MSAWYTQKIFVLVGIEPELFLAELDEEATLRRSPEEEG
jgi:hypothetical protein